MDLPLVADPESGPRRSSQVDVRRHHARALRRAPSAWHRRHDQVVRRRPVLRVPLGQRVGKRATRSCSTCAASRNQNRGTTRSARSRSCCRTCASTRTCTATGSTCAPVRRTRSTSTTTTPSSPSIDLSRQGRPNRYTYNVHISPENTLLFDGIVKYDVTTGSDTRWWCGPGRWASESPFAPRAQRHLRRRRLPRQLRLRPTRRSLGSGDPRRNRHRRRPGGRVLLPQRVPIGFHATWVPGWKLQ